MALLLHLTDLHLGSGGADKSTADEKVKVIPPHEMETRLTDTVRLIERVIDKLKGDRLTSIVISGDITVGNRVDGYSRLKEFIERLAPLIPSEKGAVIAVPGNHDVEWGTEASSAERYQNFKQFVRDDLKATTPYLDGVDSIQKGRVRMTGAKKAYFVNKEHAFAVVPLNTSNYCGSNLLIEGVTRPDIELFLEEAKGLPKGEAIVKSLERLTRFDIARVSPDQIRAFEIAVKSARQELKENPEGTLIIGTFHHNLAPVTRYEELKAFETLTNLGRLQETFTELNVQIALHGHKHQSTAYWDSRRIVGEKASEMLVLSGGSVGGEGYSPQIPFRLVEINRVEGGHNVQVHNPQDYIGDKPAFVRMGLIHGKWEKPVSADDRSTIIEADTFDRAHESVRNLPLFEDNFNHPLNNLVTMVRDGNSVTSKVPVGYPKDVVDDPNTIDGWFEEIAGWWQTDLSELSSDLYFTHGTRIKRYRGIVNQLQHAAEMLKSLDPKNGRAIISLTDPESDFRNGNNKKRGGWFPAFSMAQAYITNDGGRSMLNIVGFYRKQEMRYWWAVNMRELRLMADALLAHGVKASIGSIATVATIAIADSGKPRVAVPVLDRWYDKDKGKIAQLVLSAVTSSQRDQVNDADQEKLILWRAIIADLIPAELPAGAVVENVPLATKGLELTHALLKAFSEFEPSSKLVTLTECFSRIQNECASIVQTVLRGNSPSAFDDYDRSRKVIVKKAQEARNILQEIFHAS